MGDMQHPIGRDALEVGGAGCPRVVGAGFVGPPGGWLPPGVALAALQDLGAAIAPVVVARDHVGLEQLQAVRDTGVMVKQRYRASEALGENFAIACPAFGEQALSA